MENLEQGIMIPSIKLVYSRIHYSRMNAKNDTHREKVS